MFRIQLILRHCGKCLQNKSENRSTENIPLMNVKLPEKVGDRRHVNLWVHSTKSSESWATTKMNFDKLNSCHRRHLRIIMGITWPKKITNDNLYLKTKSGPVTEEVEKRRLKMFQKIVKGDENSPAYASLEFAINNGGKLKPRRGRPKTNLLSILQSDLKHFGFKLGNSSDLQKIRDFIDEGGKFEK